MADGSLRRRLWQRRAEKGAAARRVVDALVADASIVPDKDNVVLTMALFQNAIGRHGWYEGLLQNVVSLLQIMSDAAGVVSKLIFVAAGIGHAEHALAELMKRVAKADPVRFAALQHFDVVCTDPGIGASAPPDFAIPDCVGRMTAEETVAAHGHDQAVVICINPDPVNNLNIAQAAAKVGVPLVLVFAEQPTAGFDPDELESVLAAHRNDDDGKLLSENHRRVIASLVLQHDNQPKSNMTKEDWRHLNSLYGLAAIVPPGLVYKPGAAPCKAWHAFVIRPLNASAAALPPLSGRMLKAAVAAYADLLRQKKK